MNSPVHTEATHLPAPGSEYRRSDISSVPSRCLHVTLYNAETVQSYDLTQTPLTPADLLSNLFHAPAQLALGNYSQW